MYKKKKDMAHNLSTTNQTTMASTQPVAASVDGQPSTMASTQPVAASNKEPSASLVDVEKPHADEGYCTPSPPVFAVVIDEVEPDPGDSQQVDPPGKSYTEEKTSEEQPLAKYHKFLYIQFGGTNYNNLLWCPYSWKKN